MLRSTGKLAWPGQSSPGRGDSGAVAVVTALCLTVFFGMLALVLDIGHLYVVRGELQNAADSGALAGARALAPPFQTGSRLIYNPPSPDYSQAIQVAGDPEQNQADWENIAFGSGDIILGHWGWPGESFPLNRFTPGFTEVNAVMVKARKDQSINQPVATWFGRIFGVETVDVGSLEAVAALGYASSVPPGIIFPIALNQTWLNQQLLLPNPGGGVTFNPDQHDSGGWCGPIDHSINANLLMDWMANGFPEQLSHGDFINLINGVLDSVLNQLKHSLPRNSQQYIMSDGTVVNGWLVLAPVIGVDTINQSTRVLDYQPMIITDVVSQGTGKTIKVVFPYGDRSILVPGALSGGPKSKVLASIPRLVQ